MDMSGETKVNGSAKASLWRKTYSISLKWIVCLLIVISLFSVFFINVEAHRNWDLMREEARQYGWWMITSYSSFPLFVQNQSLMTYHERSFVQIHILGAANCLIELAATDPQHAEQLFSIEFFLSKVIYVNTSSLNDTSKAILLNDLDGLATAIPDSYYNSFEWSSGNTDNGEPPFWYFNYNPCNETILQNAVALADQGKMIISDLLGY